MDLRVVVKSVVDKGKKSPFLNDFIFTCVKISVAALNKSKYREYVLAKTGLRTEDFAIDSVSDIFKENEGKYDYIVSYFKTQNINFMTVNEEILNTKLCALIISATNQKIVEVREDFGELYFKVKRAVHVHTSRKSGNYKKILFNNELCFYTCKEEELNDRKEIFPIELLQGKIHLLNFAGSKISNMVDTVFIILNSQDKYNKIIPYTELVQNISGFLKSKMENFMKDLENVHYYIEEET